MGTVHGPYDQDDWEAMLVYRNSIADMKNRDGRDRFANAISKHTAILKRFYSREAA